jgi:hypothetical protein
VPLLTANRRPSRSLRSRRSLARSRARSSAAHPRLNLLPIEIAPEVLAVNSDFDEGRVDSTTGYPIPDCDDMPGVDPETGAGNTMLRIDTEREHLDERFANDERVTEDMHKGWFADS